MMSTGIAVPSMPMASPAMMLVACPVTEARAIVRTGQNCAPVKNSVTATMSTVMTTPITAHQKRLNAGWSNPAKYPPLSRTIVTAANPARANTAETRSPRYSAPMIHVPRPMRTKAVPMIEAMMLIPPRMRG